MYLFYLYHPDMNKPQRLKYDPVGWDTLGKKLIRDRKWHGVFFEYTPKLQFVKDGRGIVHYYFERYGIEAEITILIYKKSRKTRKFVLDYTGRLNLTSLEISTLFATCNIEQTGFLQKFKNRADVKVNLQSLVDLDGKAISPFSDEYKTIPLHSKTFRRQFIGVGSDLTGSTQIFTEGTANHYWSFPLSPSVSEIDDYYEYEISWTNTSNPKEDAKYNWLIKEAGTYQFTFNQHFTIDTDLSVDWDSTIEVHFVYGREGAYTTVVLYTGEHNIRNAVSFSATYADSIALTAEDEVFLYVKITTPILLTGNYNMTFRTALSDGTVGTAGVIAETTFPATESSVMLVHECWDRVVRSITGKANAFKSNYYGRTDSEPATYDEDGEGSLRGMAPGFWLRGFPVSDKSKFISFKDLQETFQAIDGIAIGVEIINNREVVRAEPISHFYKAVEIIKLNWVRDIKKGVAADYYYNELEIGTKKWANEEVNNLDEFNTKRSYSLPITQIKNKLTLISPTITSGYTLEFVRRDAYTDASTKDNENDNENFVVQLRRNEDGFEPDRNQDFDVLENIIDPDSVYNAKLSLSRCIKKNSLLIRSFLEHHTDKTLRLTLAEGNSKMVSKLSVESESINEGADILVSSLTKPVFVPEIYSFKTKISEDQMEAIELAMGRGESPEEMYGYISFSATDKDWKKGYLLEMEPDPKSDLTTIKLLKANL